MTDPATTDHSSVVDDKPAEQIPTSDAIQPKEIGGRAKGLDPTRYGDWEKNGRCIDF